jgi:hypothetical protein
MSLSSDLISQFVKTTVEAQEKPQESTTYGTTIIVDGVAWVKLDGSDLLTPVSTTADVKDNERVTVMVKDHTATITGNMSSPSASSEDLNDATEKIETVEADNVIIHNTLQAANAEIGNLTAENVKINGILEAASADIETLRAATAEIDTLKADVAEINEANIQNLEAVNAYIYNLDATYGTFQDVTTGMLFALTAQIDSLDTKYANIDFANIGDAAIENLYAGTGLIKDLAISEGHITGELAAVTINADSIKAGTLATDRLLIAGDDGLYYQLNLTALGDVTISELPEEDQEALKDGLHGDSIIAKSITAEKIYVDELSAFGATIGGFHISDGALYSEVKDSEGNTTRGVYFGSDGQMNIGDETNYIKFVEEDGVYRLEIAAESILFRSTSVEDAIDGINDSIEDLERSKTYIRFGSDEEGDNPFIELGEETSPFKVLITNERIQFLEDETEAAYISNQALHIRQAVIEDNLQQGQFEWKARANGNLGLVWKGVTS